MATVTTSFSSATTLETGFAADDIFTGGTGNDVLTGGAGNDTLDGGSGNDTMSGGSGNDLYIVAQSGDVVIENADSGTDSVQSSVTHTLAANVEHLTLTGVGNSSGNGNTLDNQLTGNNGNNTLNGGTGNDTMAGGLGNDTYVVNAAGDVVTEAAAEGTDTVQASTSHTLAENVENLTLTGAGNSSGNGNTLANQLAGNNGNNTLNGGTGNDTMAGGLGNDTYVVNAAGDVVTEAAAEGTDTVQASTSHTLAENVENLTLTLTGAGNSSGNGNSLDNILTGNSGDNVVNGGTGNDTMIGGAGNDSYSVNAAGDVITEGAGAGTDSVNAALSYALTANVENLTLTGAGNAIGTGNTLNNKLNGNSGNNTLTGNDGADTITGGSGADTITGGSENDVYIYAAATDSTVAVMDTITDFVQGQDKIDLGALLGEVNLKWGGLTPTQLGVWFELDGNGNTMVKADTNDDLTPDLVIKLQGVIDPLTADDFIGVNLPPVAVDNAYITAGNLDDVAAGLGGFKIVGEDANDWAGFSVAAVGDINGDSLGDFIIGASQVQNGPSASGSAYVVFGKTDTASVDLSDIAAGNGGFKIIGEAEYLDTGYSVSSAGDVNNDGITDFLIGSPDDHNILTDPNINAGGTYVVFGKNDTIAVNLADVAAGSGGFKIIGDSAYDLSGVSVSAVGDVNADGFADVVIGAFGDSDGGLQAGAAYVVFGKDDGLLIDLEDVANGIGGFKIVGESANDEAGWSVSGAGDVNGDNVADVIIGSFQTDTGGGDTGAAYVVFGKADTADVDLDSVAAGTGGFKIIGESAGDLAGVSVSGAGDVNDDGLADVVVAAPGNGSDGAAYVVFGKNDSNAVNLSDVASGDGGFKIVGEAGVDLASMSVSAAGDVNDDGYADLIIGRFPPEQASDSTQTSAAYVVYGGSGLSSVSLADVAAGVGGFKIVGETGGDFAGHAVSAAGDVNGDGVDDLLVGAFRSDAEGTDSGAAYVIYGSANRVSEDAPAIIGNVLDNDTDVEGDALTIYSFDAVSTSGAAITAGTTPGTFVYDPTGSATIQALEAGESITDTFSYTISDDNGGFDTALVSVTVHGANDEPALMSSLSALAGEDRTYGGAGNDILVGGAGADIFDYNALTDATDTITGFTAGVGGDKMDLDALLTVLGYEGADPIAAGYVQLMQAGAHTQVNIDSNGGGDNFATTLVTLQNVTAGNLTLADNFIV